MRFTFTVHVELERESGKFMSRDDALGELQEAIEGADPGSITGGADGDSTYNTVQWDVEETT